MKKVDIVTYCDWHSYGSILQSLGLQQTLRELGFDSRVLHPQLQHRSGSSGLRQRIVNLHRWLIREKILRRQWGTDAFLQKNLNEEMLQDGMDLADAYIAGSDQIWHPYRMESSFFLAFVPEGVRKISYAASMGIPVIPQEKKDDYCRYFRRFDRLSVRESDAQAVIGALTDQEVQQHIDPVFLLERDHWRQYERPYPGMKKPYILVYAIYWDRNLNKELAHLRRKTGMDVVAVCGGLRQIYATKRIYDADPGQFLWLVDHAEAVVSSSFHGVAMAALFGKRFSAVIDPASPSRLRCLLDTLNRKNLPVEALLKQPAAEDEALRRRICEERDRGRIYLKQALEGI